MNNLSKIVTPRVLWIFSTCFAVLHLILGATNANVYTPSWRDTLARCFVFAIFVRFRRSQELWFSVLMVVEVVTEPLMFWGFGIDKSTVFYFVLAACWFLIGLWYFKLDRKEPEPAS
jgi:hypothetical protein